jgi:predicted PilT family ATPase
MPLWEAVETKKSKSSKMSDYAKVAIDRHLESILPCSFISKVSGNDIELFVPKSEKWSIVGRWGENIRGLEQEIWLNIHVRTYEDLPILDTKVNVENNNSSIVLYFPKWYENKNVYIMVWKELLHTQTNANWQIIIKKKNYIKTMTSKWFTLIDYEKI